MSLSLSTGKPNTPHADAGGEDGATGLADGDAAATAVAAAVAAAAAGTQGQADAEEDLPLCVDRSVGTVTWSSTDWLRQHDKQLGTDGARRHSPCA